MKYVIYLRISSEKQDYRTQLDEVLTRLKQKHPEGFTYLVFCDEKTSKRVLKKRKGLQEAIAALEKGDVLVGTKIDRLARNVYETTQIIDTLEKRHAGWIMIDQPGLENKVILGAFAGIAEEEVKLIRSRTKAKLRSKSMRNERISGKLPYGYDLDMVNLIPVKDRTKAGWIMKPGLLIPNPVEQQVLREMKYWHSQGHSYKEIATLLTKTGYKNREGKPFQTTSVFRILKRIKHAEIESQNTTTHQLIHSA